MKKTLICLLSFAASLLVVFASYAEEPTYTYNQLGTKDLDQMNALVKDAIKRAKKDTPPNGDVLRDITRTIFMRANRDQMIDKVFGDVRALLEENGELETTFNALILEAIEALKNEKTRSTVQVSYLVLLENFMSEFKPEMEEQAFVKKLIKKVYDAKIEVSDKAKSERKLRLMEGNYSPSEVAGRLLGIKK